MPLQATSGAASQDAFGGNGVAVVPTYIEDVFSTWLYTGTGALQTITNNIDLSTKGGLVWLKSRSATYNHYLQDTTRGIQNTLTSNDTSAQSVANDIVNSTSTSGFVVQSYSGGNNSGSTYASWTFRKQPKFFDVVTYTGTGVARTVAHNLGSVPGCIIVKRTDTAGFDWIVYHRSTGNTNRLLLNDTVTAASGTSFWNDTTPTSTVFTVGTNVNGNASGGTYVAYLFAHDAGGFGLTGTDNVISCGSYTGTGATGNAVTLGYEPQWLMVKNVTEAGDWIMYDNMRGMPASDVNTGNTKILRPNLSNAESGGATIAPTATGFVVNTTFAAVNTTGNTFIYIAIRRGPMKVPTTGTSVFSPIARTGTGSAANITTAGFTPDLLIGRSRLATTSTPVFVDRLRGNTKFLQSAVTDAEGTSGSGSDVTGFLMNGFSLGVSGGTDLNTSSASEIYYPLKRAPSFMDVVCYTGTGSSPATQNHNLGVIPEFILAKKRSAAQDWYPFFQNGSVTNWMQFFALSSAAGSSAGDLSSDVSATTFSANTFSSNNSSATYVAYLFATCAGVSKVGKYTGTGTTLQINCGFTAGARFVLIKRTDSTGDWYVWDTARGIVSGNDPYLLLNSTAAEVTSTDYIDTYSAGFEISSTAPAAINASGGNFVFLAIA